MSFPFQCSAQAQPYQLSTCLITYHIISQEFDNNNSSVEPMLEHYDKSIDILWDKE